MLEAQNELNNLLSKIPQKFISTILEYVKVIKSKVDKGELTDTEYLESIPGMSDSIVKESAIDRSQYKDKLDW
ncbi:MAG: hypothetical protein RDU14_07965 [Melioribacteraceae bacterium]|nr:hypothetical protein [Melioribacteraceae bacterium]